MHKEADIDFETKSYCDLKKSGAWAYSEDPTTDIICFSYDLNDGLGVRSWWPGKVMEYAPGTQMPLDLYLFVKAGGVFVAWNIAFEYSICWNVAATKYGWILPAEDCWRDIQATARYYAMPPALDNCARVLGFEGKDPAGDRLITKYSKLHLKTAKAIIPHDDLMIFVKYCEKDVRIEQSVDDFLGDLPEREAAIWQLNQRINRRGLYLDLEGIEAAAEIVDQRAAELTLEFRKLTGVGPGQHAKVMAWFAGQGLKLENLRKDDLEEVLEDEETPIGQGPVRRAIELRLQINKASTKKLDAMARQRGSDGRARYQTIYHGASTGRETGTGLQPLNLTRGFEKLPPEMLVRDIMRKDAKFLDCVYGDAMNAVSKASRHWIMAEEGNIIRAGDFVSVEAVVLACLAGEEWKIKAFRDGVKIYEHMGDKIYGLPPGTVTKDTHPNERQDGKTGELAFGYQGALNAWLKFDSSGRHTDERIIEICKSWRSEHPCIVQFWRDLEDAAIEAVRNPGRCCNAGPIGFEVVRDAQDGSTWLSMILPDGKRMWYWQPELRLTWPQWHKPTENLDCYHGTCDCKKRPQVTYMAQKNGVWRRQYTYGGKLAENATQATSRQIMMPGLVRLDDMGYSMILSVYDEGVSEDPEGFGSLAEFCSVLKECPGDWARGWPINVDGWEGKRYKK